MIITKDPIGFYKLLLELNGEMMDICGYKIKLEQDIVESIDILNSLDMKNDIFLFKYLF